MRAILVPMAAVEFDFQDQRLWDARLCCSFVNPSALFMAGEEHPRGKEAGRGWRVGKGGGRPLRCWPHPLQLRRRPREWRSVFRRLSGRNRRRLLLRSSLDLFRPIRHAKCKLLRASSFKYLHEGIEIEATSLPSAFKSLNSDLEPFTRYRPCIVKAQSYYRRGRALPPPPPRSRGDG